MRFIFLSPVNLSAQFDARKPGAEEI